MSLTKQVFVVRRPSRIDEWWLRRFPNYKLGEQLPATVTGGLIAMKDARGDRCEPSCSAMIILEEKYIRIQRMCSLGAV